MLVRTDFSFQLVFPRPTVEKLLLIADPQLIGEKDEGFFGAITRIDADRYLAKSFALAHDYVRPDWTLFLGDIFDEGLSANDEEFKRYFERFDAIFQFDSHAQRSLVVPGDNDVGGEYYGDKQPVLRQRFRNYFGQLVALFKQNEIEFLKVNRWRFDSRRTTFVAVGHRYDRVVSRWQTE